jgi:hypothetical protein
MHGKGMCLRRGHAHMRTHAVLPLTPLLPRSSPTSNSKRVLFALLAMTISVHTAKMLVATIFIILPCIR